VRRAGDGPSDTGETVVLDGIIGGASPEQMLDGLYALADEQTSKDVGEDTATAELREAARSLGSAAYAGFLQLGDLGGCAETAELIATVLADAARPGEGLLWFDRAIAHGVALAAFAPAASVLLDRAALHLEAGSAELAAADAETAVTLLGESATDEDTLIVLADIGRFLCESDVDPDRGTDLWWEAGTSLERIGALAEASRTQFELGSWCSDRADEGPTRRFAGLSAQAYAAAVRTSESDGNAFGTVRGLIGTGFLAMRAGESHRALDPWRLARDRLSAAVDVLTVTTTTDAVRADVEESLGMTTLDATELLALVANGVGELQAGFARYDDAEASLTLADAMFVRLGDRESIARNRLPLIAVLQHRGRFDEAEALLEGVERIAEEDGSNAVWAEADFARGALFLDLGRVEEARPRIERAVAALDEDSSPTDAAAVLSASSRLLLAAGEPRAAIEPAELAIARLHGTQPFMQAVARIHLTHALILTEHGERVVRMREQGLRAALAPDTLGRQRLDRVLAELEAAESVVSGVEDTRYVRGSIEAARGIALGGLGRLEGAETAFLRARSALGGTAAPLDLARLDHNVARIRVQRAGAASSPAEADRLLRSALELAVPAALCLDSLRYSIVGSDDRAAWLAGRAAAALEVALRAATLVGDAELVSELIVCSRIAGVAAHRDTADAELLFDGMAGSSSASRRQWPAAPGGADARDPAWSASRREQGVTASTDALRRGPAPRVLSKPGRVALAEAYDAAADRYGLAPSTLRSPGLIRLR